VTKDCSLAGVRLGYVTGPVGLIYVPEQLAITWSVNEFAQIAGIAAIEAQAEYECMWRDLRDESTSFKAGYSPLETPMHYFLMEVGGARLLGKRLLAEVMLVRLCESFDLPNYIRLSTQLPEQNRRLLDLLKIEKSLQT
jgi:histidinol-phosphate aminotransferase